MKKVLLSLFCLLTSLSFAKTHEFDLLKALSNANAPSGFEESVRQILSAEWKPYLSKIKTDGMGNLVGEIKRKNAPKILLMAHMDEVGFLVSAVNKHGLLRVQTLGGFDDNVLAAQRYKIQTAKGEIDAYSGIEAIHIIPKDKRGKLIKKEQLFLDIGVKSRKEALELGVYPGSPVTPASQFTQLTDTRFLAKALDDRIGLAVITDAMKNVQDTTNNVFFAATVQEEVGLRGANIIYNDVKPDVAINLEIGIASDFPLRFGKKSSDIRLGKGPTVFVYDASMIPNQALLHWVVNVAKKEGIALQYEIEPGYGEDGANIQNKGHGVPAINIGIPVRYAHQQAGIFDAKDYRQAVKLVSALVRSYDKKALL